MRQACRAGLAAEPGSSVPGGSTLPVRRALRNAKTEEQRQTILEEIDCAAWDIGAINVENIGDTPSSDPEVRRWGAKLMNGDGLAPKTAQRILSALRGYWRYLACSLRVCVGA